MVCTKSSTSTYRDNGRLPFNSPMTSSCHPASDSKDSWESCTLGEGFSPEFKVVWCLAGWDSSLCSSVAYGAVNSAAGVSVETF